VHLYTAEGVRSLPSNEFSTYGVPLAFVVEALVSSWHQLAGSCSTCRKTGTSPTARTRQFLSGSATCWSATSGLRASETDRRSPAPHRHEFHRLPVDFSRAVARTPATALRRARDRRFFAAFGVPAGMEICVRRSGASPACRVRRFAVSGLQGDRIRVQG